MEKIVEKISSYHLLNTLIPGACFVYFSNMLLGIELLVHELFFDILIIIIYGIIVSRIGSVFIEKIALTLGLSKVKYQAYITAEKQDEKIKDLLETRNLFRSCIAAFVLIIFEKCYLILENLFPKIKNMNCLIISIILIFLFSCSFWKQNKYIVGRVEKINANQLEKEND